MSRRWTKIEDQALLDGIGTFGIQWLVAHTSSPRPGVPHRSVGAIYARACFLFGSGGLLRGAYTLRQLERESGYSKTQLLRAMGALGQKWRRLSPKGVYLISDEQVDELYVWLRHDYWCPKLHLYACSCCGERTKPPRGLGLCSVCYWRYRRKCEELGLPVRVRDAWAIVRKLLKRGHNGEKGDKVLRKMISILRRGRALDDKLLGELAGLAG